MKTRKKPRDFISTDDLWEADEYWDRYFIEKKVWVYADEYQAQLSGDHDYSRIIIHSASDQGWLYSRTLDEKDCVDKTLSSILTPVSEKQLKALGFIQWQGTYI